MVKDYKRIIIEKLNASQQPTGETEEAVITSLIADEGKRIRNKYNGITGTRVDVGSGDDENNYEEIDATGYDEVTSIYDRKEEFPYGISNDLVNQIVDDYTLTLLEGGLM